MVNKLISQGKKILFSEQSTVLSAATVIMAMTITSQVLGFARQRAILHFFDKTQSSLFFAALRLPDLVFEVLVFGMFSSAFIPVFTKAIRTGEKQAWDIAARVVNIGLIIFILVAAVVAIWADKIYAVVAPGYSASEIAQIANLARILFVAQGFFIISYVLTGVLESLKRFLVPALAPIFYNLGLILGTIFLTSRFGLMAPAIGVVIGAILHFLIQLPLAMKLGFRFSAKISPNEGVKDIARLAAPRFIDLSFQQVVATSELYLSSIISTASYTYLTLANSLQAAPVRLFGVSLAKAALPTLTQEQDDLEKFKKTLFGTIFQIFFLIMPVITIFIVLRVPTIRLFFGTKLFDWSATVETGAVLTAYAIGIPFQASVAILSRAFYALHDTKTPVLISVIGDALVVFGDFLLVKGFGFPAWGIALSFTIGAFLETLILLFLLDRRIKNISYVRIIKSIGKTLIAAFVSGWVMYFILKFFDKSVWIARLSFIDKIDSARLIPFDKFVLDTRYTLNLLILTVIVGLMGSVIYIGISFLLKSDELKSLIGVIAKRRFFVFKKTEPFSPPPSDTPVV